MTPRQPSRERLTAMAVGFSARGITDRDNRLRLISRAVGRRVTSSKDLTHAEAGDVLRLLDQRSAGDLTRVLAALIAGEEADAADAARPAPTPARADPRAALCVCRDPLLYNVPGGQRCADCGGWSAYPVPGRGTPPQDTDPCTTGQQALFDDQEDPTA